MTTEWKSKYAQKLKDPRWQKMRLKVLERDHFTCRWCNDAESTLHVHHLRYPKHGKDPWDIDTRSLLTLCESCHETESAEREERRRVESTLLDCARCIPTGDLLELATSLRFDFVPIDFIQIVIAAICHALANPEAQLALIQRFCDDLKNGRAVAAGHSGQEGCLLNEKIIASRDWVEHFRESFAPKN